MSQLVRVVERPYNIITEPLLDTAGVPTMLYVPAPACGGAAGAAGGATTCGKGGGGRSTQVHMPRTP